MDDTGQKGTESSLCVTHQFMLQNELHKPTFFRGLIISARVPVSFPLLKLDQFEDFN